jgi:release factor glutamine methyltransferase
MTELLVVRSGREDFDLELDEGVHAPGPSSLELAALLGDCRGRSVLDLGCGTGLFAIAAARAGARDVWATDVDPRAAECAGRNALRNGADVRVARGDLFDPVAGRSFDLIVTNPPQTPAPEAARGPKFGGEDGLRLFEPLLRQAPDHLRPGGRLLTMLISLADTRRLEAILAERFRAEVVRERDRSFTKEEYEGYWPGLFAFLEDRRRRGLAEFAEREGRFAFRVRYYRASLR